MTADGRDPLRLRAVGDPASRATMDFGGRATPIAARGRSRDSPSPETVPAGIRRTRNDQAGDDQERGRNKFQRGSEERGTTKQAPLDRDTRRDSERRAKETRPAGARRWSRRRWPRVGPHDPSPLSRSREGARARLSRHLRAPSTSRRPRHPPPRIDLPKALGRLREARRPRRRQRPRIPSVATSTAPPSPTRRSSHSTMPASPFDIDAAPTTRSRSCFSTPTSFSAASFSTSPRAAFTAFAPSASCIPASARPCAASNSSSRLITPTLLDPRHPTRRIRPRSSNAPIATNPH
jgi:hypothetical protein